MKNINSLVWPPKRVKLVWKLSKGTTDFCFCFNVGLWTCTKEKVAGTLTNGTFSGNEE